ncbi:TPA: hypothetical protein ACFRHA_000411 [Neisseria subflava]
MTRDSNAIGLRYLPNGRLLKNGNIPINTINKFKFKILLSQAQQSARPSESIFRRPLAYFTDRM